jgi:hypothetical protein
VDIHDQRSSRLVGGTLVLLALIGILLSFGAPQKVHQAKPVSTASFAPGPPPAVRTSSEWPGVVYLEIRAFYSSTPFFGVMHAGIPDHVEDKDGVLLSADQERQLIAAVSAELRPYDVLACWYPRHAFVFYDPLGKPVAEVNICFECMIAEGGPSDSPDIGSLAKLVSDLGLPLGKDVVEAEKYRKGFEKWVKEHPRTEW